ncbi:MAG: redoxin domain-containing protein [Acidobacteriaceae bacterium]|nr:redoxin domain-containing protein [Acidobacteriaceae bacterium]
MRKVGISAVLMLSLAAAFIPSTQVRAAEKKAPMTLKVGDMAPDFKLQYFDGHDLKDVTLSQYRGKKNVVLAFYIFAFTGG